MLDLTNCLDTALSKPLYEQLYEHLAGQIRSGRLRKGDKLPSKRSLAGQIGRAHV